MTPFEVATMDTMPPLKVYALSGVPQPPYTATKVISLFSNLPPVSFVMDEREILAGVMAIVKGHCTFIYPSSMTEGIQIAGVAITYEVDGTLVIGFNTWQQPLRLAQVGDWIDESIQLYVGNGG